MIPKKIHYCWFGGGELPEKDKKCIETWKKYCPDYEIIRWDESNYDVTKNRYMLEAYEAKKWGFVPDYARLDIIYEHGGIYLDTDVELVRDIDDLLDSKAFMGFESGGKSVNPGQGFGAERRMPTILEIRDNIYGDRVFRMGPNEYNTTPSPILHIDYLERIGLEKNNQTQVVKDVVIYASDYFCPVEFGTGKITVTENTYSIHHYHASWLEPEEKIIIETMRELRKKFGTKKAAQIGFLFVKSYRIKMHLRTKGFNGTVLFMIKKVKRLLNRCNEHPE